jgi:hypothetical protein
MPSCRISPTNLFAAYSDARRLVDDLAVGSLVEADVAH